MTTLANDDAPWANRPCPMQVDAPKTNLDADCRCGDNSIISAPTLMCLRPYRVYTDHADSLRAGVFGDGPHVFEFGSFSELRKGFFHAPTREIILAGRFRAGDDPIRGNHNGFIMAIQVDSGDRRIVSGAWYDRQEQAIVMTGDGPGFWDTWDVAPGPDGELYAYDYLGAGMAQIFRVDPLTGDREFIWTNEMDMAEEHMGQCDHGSTIPSTRFRPNVQIQMGNPGFAVDSEGRFYMGFEQGGRYTGVGIIRVSNDGTSCEYFSRTGAGRGNEYYQEDVGEGATFSDQGSMSALSIYGDHLYTVNSLTGALYRVELATGRRRFLIGSVQAVVNTLVNPHDPNEIMTVGRDTKTVIETNWIDEEASADLFTFQTFNRGTLMAGTLGSGGVWWDPEDPDIVYFSHDNWSIVKAEMSTFNNLIISL